MRAHGLDQGEIAGSAGHALAFVAIALADDLADALAEGAALIAQRTEPKSVGRRHVTLQPLRLRFLMVERVAVGADPSRPEAAEA